MRIDPDGPHAHGRSYTSAGDDYYSGYGYVVGDDGAESMAGGDGDVNNGGKESRAEGTPPAALSSDGTAGCVLSYRSGTIETVAAADARVLAVAVDSQVRVL